MYNPLSCWYYLVMSKPNVAIAGYRGMVGSVLMERMQEEHDFESINATLVSTSQAGHPTPEIENVADTVGDANNLDFLSSQDVIITTQGSDYTERIHPKLREMGWDGFWIDAASSLRYEPDSVLVLDPVNRRVIDEAIDSGKKDLIGANCTTATMLMGLSGLFTENLVEIANPATYQAVSGAGSKKVSETLRQMSGMPYDPNDSAMTMLDKVQAYLSGDNIETVEFGAPIAGNAIPLIDELMESAKSREEWKAGEETRKITGNQDIKVDGTCVRIASMRSHAQVVNMKLKKELPIEAIKEIITGGNEWVDMVEDDPEQIRSSLTPVATSGSMNIVVGRIRKLENGPDWITAFVVGDQLLWGAAEPLRRALKIVLKNKQNA